MLRNPHISRRKRRSGQSLVTWCCLGLTAYFVYHTVVGSYGLEARSRFIQRSNLLSGEMVALEAVRTRLDRDARLLNVTVPDLDLVDELARDVLGLIRPDELIIISSQIR